MKSYDTSGFVLLSDIIPDIIQEIRYFSTYNFVGERIDGYLEPVALLTKEAAAALKIACARFRELGYAVKIFDTYRPQRAVDHFVRWAEQTEDIRMKPYFYPEVDKSKLFDEGYISKNSGHSRGSTVDLTLIDMVSGKELDMGGPFDYFGMLSHPDFEHITDEQKKNRRILCDVMTDCGFAPITSEWWHFILKDEPYPDTYFDFPVQTSLL